MTGPEMERLELGPVRTTLPVPAVTRLQDRRLLIERCKLGCTPEASTDLDHAAHMWVVHAEVGP